MNNTNHPGIALPWTSAGTQERKTDGEEVLRERAERTRRFNRRGGLVVECSPRVREIVVRSSVSTDLSC